MNDDLFENLDQLPAEARAVCEHYISRFDTCTEDAYMLCAEFLAAIEAIGFTFEYGLDGTPFDLQPIEETAIALDFDNLATQLDHTHEPTPSNGANPTGK